jgi:hypothetical protein
MLKITCAFIFMCLAPLASDARAQTRVSPEPNEPAPKAGDPARKEDGLPQRSEFSDLAKAMKNCMDAWDAGTRMSKGQWEASCRRTLHEQPTIDGLGQQGQPKKKKL